MIMSSLEQHNLSILKTVLETDFIPFLPPFIKQNEPSNKQEEKNLSRAFGAFALAKICSISAHDAAEAVIDDFDDNGVDAIYYHALTKTVYFVQSKLKARSSFNEDEAVLFCRGIRKLITLDFDGFNQNVQKRQTDIEDVLEACHQIVVVVAHIGEGLSQHARRAINELLSGRTHGDTRLKSEIVDYDAERVVSDLQNAQAYEQVDTDLFIEIWQPISNPKDTHFGLIQLKDLVALHEKYGKALYERNIRTFLGHKTDVNISIQQTLTTNPQDFVYLNNGVTALCQKITPLGPTRDERKRLKIEGISVINGAQTIASAAKFSADNQNSDISSAKVSLTLIKADSDSEFGKAVTRARNHQNQVSSADFAALDDEQERLRREIAYLGISYVYKAAGAILPSDSLQIGIEEATQALSLLQNDPRYVVWLKADFTRLLDLNLEQYKMLFNSSLTAYQLVNAVRVNRYFQMRMRAEANSALERERLIYKNGNYAAAWILAKRVKTAIKAASLIDENQLGEQLSAPFDELRQMLIDETQKAIFVNAPSAFFKNQSHVNSLLQSIMLKNFGFENDDVVRQKITRQTGHNDLFDYLSLNAPQINLA